MTDKNENNVVSFSARKKTPEPQKKEPQKEPLLNLPSGVKALCILMIFIHVGLLGLPYLTDGSLQDTVILNWAFIPARFSGDFTFLPYTILTPVTYALFHSGMFHILMNTIMLAAFGAGFEKNFGTKNLMIVFWGSSIFAALVHFILDTHSMAPMVGASGGISGLFAGLLLAMHRSGQFAPNQKLLPIVFIFIAISFVFGLFSSPDGNPIAWAAHIGGFLGGLFITYLLLKRR